MAEPVNARSGWSAVWAPNATVFLSSGTIMVVELVAGRLISRYLGMSLYTWTTIIGVMMAGMSLGNFLGGRFADRFRTRRALATLFLLSAIGCAAVLPLNTAMGQWPLLHHMDSWPLRILIHISVVFALPATLLGTINPVIAKFALSRGRSAGRSVGGVFASSVAGSILGTFLAGFYLVYWFGAVQIMLSAAVAMGILGLVYAMLAARANEERPTPPSQVPGAAKAGFWERLTPNATVFASNVAFMVLELAASRIIAREFGASLYTWTTIIGVVLAGITLGNYLGGRLADRRSTSGTVGILFFLASISMAASIGLSHLGVSALQNIIFLMRLPWPAQILFFTALAFLLPYIFIGCISPVVAKRALEQGRAAGRTVGNIYAWGAVGSILGTFASGYFLIDWMGSAAVIAVTALTLAVIAVGCGPWRVPGAIWAGLCAGILARCLLGGPSDPNVVYEDESQYSYIAVRKDAQNPRLREMILDKLTHSQVDLDAPEALKYEYEWIYEGVLDTFYPGRRPLTAMVIGGGGYAFPHYLERARPGSYVEASEIDPAVTEAAFAAFGLPRDTTVHIYNMDARNRIADLIAQRRQGESIPVFDCIMGDSINDYAVPYHLTTLEFTRLVGELLSDDGVYLLNLIDMFQSAGFLSSVVNTCRQVFPLVYVFNTGRPGTVRDTFVVVCAKRPLDMRSVAGHIRAKYKFKGDLIDPAAIEERIQEHGAILLTDNYAPVENLLAPVVLTRKSDIGQVYLDRARRFFAAGALDKAMAACRSAIKEHPFWPEANQFLASLLAQSGDRAAALDALRAAIKGSDEPGPIRLSLGIALLGEGQLEAGKAEIRAALDTDEGLLKDLVIYGVDAINAGNADLAIALFEIATQMKPEEISFHDKLGMAFAAKQRLPEAIAEWEKIVDLDPKETSAYKNLVLGYTLTEKYDAAWEAVAKLRAQNEAPEPELLNTLRQRSGRNE